MKKQFFSLCLLMLTLSGFCQNIDYSLNDIWSSADSVWENSSRRTYFYESGNLTMVLGEYLFADSSNWSPVARYMYSNNTDLTISENVYELWNGDSNNWETDSRVSYSYTNDGFLLSTVNEDWIDEAWLPVTKNENTYNSNNILTENFISFWDTLTGDWLPTYKYQYTYNTDGKLLNRLMEIYDNSQWVYFSELNYSYTDFGKISETTEPLDPDGDGLLSGSRTLYTYDTDENLIQTLRESIYQPTQDWRPVLKHNYININAGSVLSSTRQMNIGIDTAQWINFGRLTYFYLNPTYIQEEPQALSFAMFPNPTSETVHFQLGKFKEPVSYTVMNIDGKTILKGSINSTNTIVSTAGLTSGIYLVELRSGDKIGISKLVKQ